jgi:acetyl-CoA C-acetyltransferase
VQRAVIVASARTPIGRARKGLLARTDAFALAEVVVAEVLKRGGVPGSELDDLVLAESLQGGGVIARHTAVRLGFDNVPGLAVNRHCAGGLAAVQAAVASIMIGTASAVVAGGTESLSTMPGSTRRNAEGEPVAWMSPTHPPSPEAPAHDMSLTVGENTAREAGLTRRDIDAWAAYSHGQAVASQDAGLFDDEIVPVDVTGPDGNRVVAERDEQPRRGVTVDTLAALPVLHPELEGATVTAGNAAGLNDGAAALLITSEDYAVAHGLRPLAAVRGWASVGVEPRRTGMAPIVAVPRALQHAGIDQDDIELWEVNEAFCSVPVAFSRALGVDQSRLNVNGSGCSLGHPIAATGARMIVTMLGELQRRGGTFGTVALCAGGGLGSALVLEVL